MRTILTDIDLKTRTKLIGTGVVLSTENNKFIDIIVATIGNITNKSNILRNIIESRLPHVTLEYMEIYKSIYSSANYSHKTLPRFNAFLQPNTILDMRNLAKVDTRDRYILIDAMVTYYRMYVSEKYPETLRLISAVDSCLSMEKTRDNVIEELVRGVQ